jgi:glycosyltransferase involved in cell wall biosynthesis
MTVTDEAAVHDATPPSSSVSVVIPARNESASIGAVVAGLRARLPDAEIIVVDDASDDDTAALATAQGARVVWHRYQKGNGAAVKSGVRAATRRVLVLMDGDGQHDPADVPPLLAALAADVDMVVGARDASSQASVPRLIANSLYNGMASWITGHRVEDLTSGFRAVDIGRFREFLSLLPNGFSYPTTITMAFFRAGYTVTYMPIKAGRRVGRSHLKPLRDGLKFLLIIFKVGTLYSPLKLFLPVALLEGFVGFSYYLYTFLEYSRFTNMSALLLASAVTTFLMGLISEQITALLYKQDSRSDSLGNNPP